MLIILDVTIGIINMIVTRLLRVQYSYEYYECYEYHECTIMKIIFMIYIKMLDLVLITIIGVIIIWITYTHTKIVCPPQSIQYRFLPRTLSEELENPVKPSDIFSKMFDDPTVFVGGVTARNVKPDNINAQYISQS